LHLLGALQRRTGKGRLHPAYIDAGIDTGRLIAHISPEVRAGDSELELFWRAVQDSAEVYAEAVARLAQGESLGMAQPGKAVFTRLRIVACVTNAT